MTAVSWVVMNLARIGIRVAAMVGATVSVPGAIALGATAIVAGAAAMRAGLQSLLRLPSNIGQTDQQRSLTTRSAIAPQKIIYGETVCSGVISFVGTSGDQARDLYHVIALAGHEVDSIKDIYLDNTKILNADINSGNAAGGDVGGTGIFKVVDSTTVVRVMKHLGDQTLVDDMVSTAFGSDYDGTHKGLGIAYIATRFTLFDGSQKTWDKHTPNNIKAQVRGKAVYDPRLDTSAGANPSDTTYFAWTDNPTLCVIDYLRDATFGLGVSSTRIDWASVVAAANVCDASVNVPGGTQKRFTCNGALFSTDTHKNNLDRLLSSMQGSLIYSNGEYFIETGYTAPSETLTDDDLIGSVAVETSFTLSDRFNTVKGVYVSDAQSNEVVEFPEVTIASAVTRDNGNTLKREIKLPFSSDTFQCQRIAHKMVQLSGQQQTIVLPTNVKGLRVRCGDRVNVTIEELGWTNKIFRCIDWAFAAGSQIGVNLTLREDSSTAYADMDSTAYTSVDGAGVINAGFPGVPAPSGLTANLIRGGIELNWINPKETAKYKEVALYTGEDGSDAWDDRIEIARGGFDFYFHDNHNIVDPIDPGDTRYYWVRALADNSGDDDDETASTKFPDDDPGTIYATAGSDSVPDSGGVVTGDLTVTNDLTALNLYVTGEEHIIEVTKLEITDPLMLLAKDQTQPLLPDLGFIARRGDDPGGEDPLNVAWVWVEGQDTFAAIGSTSDGVGTSPINITQYEPVRMGAAYINNAVDASYKLKLTGNSYLGGTLNVTGLITGDLDGDVTGDVTGDLTGTADSATLASTVTVQDTADTAAYVALFEDATGSLGAKTDAAITYNASTGALTSTSFSGSGSSLTSVDAVTLDGIDSADFVQLAGTQTITGAKTFNATVDLNGNDIDNVGSINLLNVVGDTDADTQIQFAGSNIMVFKAGGVTYQQINDGVGAVQMYKPLSLLPAVTFTNPATDLVNSINAGGFGLAHQGASDAYITSNIYYNTSGDWTAKYAGSYGAGYLKIMGGQFQWYGAGGTTVAGSAPPSSPTLLFSILTSGAATFSSTVTATSFSGSGASLTSVDAATLDGIDGADFVQRAGAQTITGTKTLSDSVELRFGTGNDARIFSDGTSGYIRGVVALQNSAGDKDFFSAVDGGGSSVLFNNAVKLVTVVGGVTVTGVLTATSFSGSGASVTNVDAATLDGLDSTAFVQLAGAQIITGNKTFNDNVKAIFGTGGDGVEIYHDANNSYIKDSGTGALRIAGSQIIFRNAADSGHMLNAVDGAGVALYFDTSTKLETVTGGVDVTGVLTATSFEGDGSSLTDLPVPSGVVTTDTTQSISGQKTFTKNIGLGVTPETWHSGYDAIQGANFSLVNDDTAGASKAVTLAYNAYIDSGNAWTYINADEASYIQQYNGALYFATAPAGSADGDITFTPRLTITSGSAVFADDVSTTGGSFQINGVDVIGNDRSGSFTTVTTTGNITTGGRFILPSTSTGNQWIYTDNTSTATGRLSIQAGEGSSGYGGGLNLFSHSHATKPGWVVAGISNSAGSGATEGRFTVNDQGIAGGTDVFTVLRTGSVGISSTSPTQAKLVIGASSSGKYLYMDDGANGLFQFKATTSECIIEASTTGWAAWETLDLRANVFVFKPNNSEQMRLDGSNLNLTSVGLSMGGTEVISASRVGSFTSLNLTGNFSAPDIDATDNMTVTNNLTVGGTVKVDGGNGYFRDGVGNSFSSGWDTNTDDYSTWINFEGYQGGTTRFRDLKIGDGKQSGYVVFDGSAKTVDIAGALKINGTEVISGGRQMYNNGTHITGQLNTTASGLHYKLNTLAAGQNAWITYQDNSVNKWEHGKNTLDKFFFYSYALGGSVLELINNGNVDIVTGALQMGGTEVISSSRAFKNMASVAIGVASGYGQFYMKQTGADAYGIVTEASANDRWLRMGHNGTQGQIHTTYLSSGGASPLWLGTQTNYSTVIIGTDQSVTLSGTLDVAGEITGTHAVFDTANPTLKLTNGNDNFYVWQNLDSNNDLSLKYNTTQLFSYDSSGASWDLRGRWNFVDAITTATAGSYLATGVGRVHFVSPTGENCIAGTNTSNGDTDLQIKGYKLKLVDHNNNTNYIIDNARRHYWYGNYGDTMSFTTSFEVETTAGVLISDLGSGGGGGAELYYATANAYWNFYSGISHTNVFTIGTAGYDADPVGDALTPIMAFHGSNRVGIGTTATPGGKLEIAASGISIVQNNASSGLSVYNTFENNGTAVWSHGYEGDTGHFRIHAGGTLNGGGLDVYSTGLLINSSSTAGQIQFKDSAGNVDGYLYATGTDIGFLDSDGQWFYQGRRDTHHKWWINNQLAMHLSAGVLDVFIPTHNSVLRVGTWDGAPKVYLNSAGSSYFIGGNVGIGTTAPSAPLCIENSTGPHLRLSRTTSSTTGQLGSIDFGNIDVDSHLAAIVCVQDGSTSNSLLSFQTEATGGSLAERMSINSEGAVKITTGIAQTYDVNFTLQNSADDSVAILFDNRASPTAQTRRWMLGTNQLTNGDIAFRRSSDSTGAPTASTLFQLKSGADGQDGVLAGEWVTFGDFTVNGTLSKTSGSFRIPHPVAELAETTDLVYSFAESNRAECIIRDVAVLAGGLAVINIDEAAGQTAGTWEALTQECQCFTTNESTWDAVRGTIDGATLRIESNNPDSTAVISWMVVGERADAHMLDPSTTMTDDEGHVIVEQPRRPGPRTIEENENA